MVIVTWIRWGSEDAFPAFLLPEKWRVNPLDMYMTELHVPVVRSMTMRNRGVILHGKWENNVVPAYFDFSSKLFAKDVLLFWCRLLFLFWSYSYPIGSSEFLIMAHCVIFCRLMLFVGAQLFRQNVSAACLIVRSDEGEHENEVDETISSEGSKILWMPLLMQQSC